MHFTAHSTCCHATSRQARCDASKAYVKTIRWTFYNREPLLKLHSARMSILMRTDWRVTENSLFDWITTLSIAVSAEHAITTSRIAAFIGRSPICSKASFMASWSAWYGQDIDFCLTCNWAATRASVTQRDSQTSWRNTRRLFFSSFAFYWVGLPQETKITRSCILVSIFFCQNLKRASTLGFGETWRSMGPGPCWFFLLLLTFSSRSPDSLKIPSAMDVASLLANTLSPGNIALFFPISRRSCSRWLSRSCSPWGCHTKTGIICAAGLCKLSRHVGTIEIGSTHFSHCIGKLRTNSLGAIGKWTKRWQYPNVGRTCLEEQFSSQGDVAVKQHFDQLLILIHYFRNTPEKKSRLSDG